MCKYKCEINPSFAGVDMFRAAWEFTGRIKYIKYTNTTFVYFEITYEIAEDRQLNILRRLKGEKQKFITVKDWMPEKHFLFREIPETTIVEC